LVSPIDLFHAQGPYKRYIRTVNDSDCQNTNFWRQHEVVGYSSAHKIFYSPDG